MNLCDAGQTVEDLFIIGTAHRIGDQVRPVCPGGLLFFVALNESDTGLLRRQRRTVIHLLCAVRPDGNGGRIHHQFPVHCFNIIEVIGNNFPPGIINGIRNYRIRAPAGLGLGAASVGIDGKYVGKSVYQNVRLSGQGHPVIHLTGTLGYQCDRVCPGPVSVCSIGVLQVRRGIRKNIAGFFHSISEIRVAFDHVLHKFRQIRQFHL